MEQLSNIKCPNSASRYLFFIFMIYWMSIFHVFMAGYYFELRRIALLSGVIDTMVLLLVTAIAFKKMLQKYKFKDTSDHIILYLIIVGLYMLFSAQGALAAITEARWFFLPFLLIFSLRLENITPVQFWR